MKDKLILKALVCSAFMCSLSVGTMAAEVSTDVKAGDTEQSSWMDRTDIGIGVKGSQKDDYRDYKTAVNPRHITTPAVYHSEHSAKQKIKAQYFIETIQLVKRYDDKSKSVLFVQGRLDGNGGDKISTRVYWNGGEGGSALVQQPHYYDKGETTEHDSLGVVASVGVGYRRLSEYEHAYVGGNIFYDYAVNDKLSRVGVGMEYVSGLNTISANVYHGLSEKKTEPYLFWNQWKTKSSSEHPKNMFYINQHKWNSIHGVNLDMHTLAGSIVKIL